MRIGSLDLARGFTIFIMPSVHFILIYGKSSIRESAFGRVVGFLAEGPGAPLFMLLMGTFFVLSYKNSTIHYFHRAIGLLVVGYLLNFLKFDIPLLSGVVPLQLLKDHGINSIEDAYFRLFLVGDILQFAGISILLLSLISKPLFRNPYLIIVLIFFISFASPFLRAIPSSQTLAGYILSLFVGNSPLIYFPIFPWLSYVIAGVGVGLYFKKSLYSFSTLAKIGSLLMLTGFLLSLTDHSYHWGDFYRTGPGGNLFYIGFDLFWIYLFYCLHNFFNDNPFFGLLKWLSKHITSVYLLQWILIFWLISVLPYNQLSIIPTLIGMVVITFGVFTITHLLISNVPYEKHYL